MSEQKRYTAQDIRPLLDTSWHHLDREMVYDIIRQAADAEEELDKLRKATKVEVHFDGAEVNEKIALRCEELRRRLEAVVKECENEISKRNQTSERCERCADDFSAGEGCPYHGEPNGCNSPTHGEFPSEKECGPFKEILRAARGESENENK